MNTKIQKLFELFYSKEDFTKLKTTLEKVNLSPLPLRGPILLIYPDSVKNLSSLSKLLDNKNISNYFKSIHILPFFKSNADGGFAASSYVDIDKKFGSWEDIQSISKKYAIIIDAIFNHTSNEHSWFKKFLKNEKYYQNFYITYQKDFDYTQIVRPRTSPLFTKIENKKVLTTFSKNQIDINIREVNLFYEFIKILIFYSQHSISGIRLDAIPYIVKKNHTSCANLKETYDFTKLLIESIKYINTSTSVITEANFSDNENFAYLTKANSDYIYQFSFSHLLFYCLYKEDFFYFVSWFRKTRKYHKKSLFYISNHDGYALSGIKRILKQEEFDEYISLLKQKKININYRQNQKTKNKEPYEVNTTFYSYLESLDKENVTNKFLLMTHILTQMNGEILLYYLDLIGEKNDFETYKKTKQNRSLHRKKFTLNQYQKKLEKSEIFSKIQEYLKQRTKTKTMDINVFFKKPFFIIVKYNSKKKITTYYNISNQKRTVPKENISLDPFSFISIIKKI